MAKYSKAAGKKVGEVLHEQKEGKLKSGTGKKVSSRKQAIAIALSEARKEGARVPEKKSSGASKGAAKKGASSKSSAPAKKAAAKKGGATSKGAASKKAAAKKGGVASRKTAPKKSARSGAASKKAASKKAPAKKSAKR
jgi:hypothetical protein